MTNTETQGSNLQMTIIISDRLKYTELAVGFLTLFVAEFFFGRGMRKAEIPLSFPSFCIFKPDHEIKGNVPSLLLSVSAWVI